MRTAEEMLDEIENADNGAGPDPVATVDDPALAKIAVAQIRLRAVSMDRTSVCSVLPSTVWVRSRLGTRTVSCTPSTALMVEVRATASVCGITPKMVISVGEAWFTMFWKEEVKENRPTNRVESTRAHTNKVD